MIINKTILLLCILHSQVSCSSSTTNNKSNGGNIPFEEWHSSFTHLTGFVNNNRSLSPNMLKKVTDESISLKDRILRGYNVNKRFFLTVLLKKYCLCSSQRDYRFVLFTVNCLNTDFSSNLIISVSNSHKLGDILEAPLKFILKTIKMSLFAIYRSDDYKMSFKMMNIWVKIYKEIANLGNVDNSEMNKLKKTLYHFGLYIHLQDKVVMLDYYYRDFKKQIQNDCSNEVICILPLIDILQYLYQSYDNETFMNFIYRKEKQFLVLVFYSISFPSFMYEQFETKIIDYFKGINENDELVRVSIKNFNLLFENNNSSIVKKIYSKAFNN